MTRREFHEGAALVGLAAVLASGRRLAAQPPAADPDRPTRLVTLGLIGAGRWGREIARSLSTVPNPMLKSVCDSSEAARRGAATVVPRAEFVSDYRRLLDDKAIEGVIVATPTHRHREIVLDALSAGKHVYCEAPLGLTIEDVIAICRAAREAKVVFQPGLQRRCHPLTKRVKSACVDGSIRQAILLNSHARERVNWMRAAATPELARERSWQAYAATSLGPVGELGIHQIDIANYWLGTKPTRVSGYGVTTTWTDQGWEVPDTTVCQLVYPAGARAAIESSTATSHWGRWEELVGTDGTVLCSDRAEARCAYLFKEPGVASAAWEVYSRKEAGFLNEPGIVMGPAPGEVPGGEMPLPKPPVLREPLYYSLGAFARCIDTGDKPLVGWQKGYEANLIAIRAAQAVRDGTTLTFAKEDFALA